MAFNKKQAVYFGGAALSFLNARLDDQAGDSNSAALNRQIERYEFLLQKGKVVLSPGEWKAMFDGMSSADTKVSPVAGIKSLWANVLDSENDGVEEKFGVDCGKLAGFIRGSTPAQQLFMLDVVERFWIAHAYIPNIEKWLEDQELLLTDNDFVK